MILESRQSRVTFRDQVSYFVCLLLLRYIDGNAIFYLLKLPFYFILTSITDITEVEKTKFLCETRLTSENEPIN